MKTLLLLCLPALLFAQQTILNGVVTVFNSKFETGKFEYIPNAQVEEVFQRANAAVTSADGTFKLILVGIPDRESFEISIRKEGLEVVNTDKLRAVAGQHEAVRIYMALKGKIAENKRKFYKIGKTESEKALTRKINRKHQELETLKTDGAANQQQIIDLQKEIADLTERYGTIDQSARELAERFSRVNLDDASELYQRAFRHFQNGSIDSSLLVLDEVDWVKRVDDILTEEARLMALKNTIAYNDSVLTIRRDSLIRAIRVKIESHLRLRQFREALPDGELLIQLQSYDAAGLFNAYREAAWLGLLARNYSLAWLYAQNASELNDSDIVASLYGVYARVLSGEEQAGLMARDKLFHSTTTQDQGREIIAIISKDTERLSAFGFTEVELDLLRSLIKE